MSESFGFDKTGVNDSAAADNASELPWHDVGEVDTIFADEITPDDDAQACSTSCRSRQVGGVQLALFRVEGEVYAIDDRCTHGNAYLSEGALEGYEVECPMHAGVFDIRTGAVLGPPATRAARRHAVRTESGRLFIRITPRP